MVYTFKGYPRQDGSAGTRNRIGIISSVICSSTVTNEIATKIPGSVPIIHSNGCAQLGDDFEVTKNMLSGAAENPNFHSSLLIGLGCETNQVTGLLNAIPKTKPIEGFSIQQMAGGTNTVERGVSIAGKWLQEMEQEKKVDLPISQLTVGIITADIDEASLQTIVPNVSGLLDILLQNGSTVITNLSKTLEPAGDLLAEKAADPELQERLNAMSKGLNRRRWDESKDYDVHAFSEDEKSLAKLEAQLVGDHKIESWLNYNEKPSCSGLHLLKSSGNIVETLSNFVSVGCNIAIVLSNRGILTTSNVIPCITVVPKYTEEVSRDFADFLIEEHHVEEQKMALLEKLIEVSSGKLTALEENELGEFAIPHIGTTF